MGLRTFIAERGLGTQPTAPALDADLVETIDDALALTAPLGVQRSRGGTMTSRRHLSIERELQRSSRRRVGKRDQAVVPGLGPAGHRPPARRVRDSLAHARRPARLCMGRTGPKRALRQRAANAPLNRDIWETLPRFNHGVVVAKTSWPRGDDASRWIADRVKTSTGAVSLSTWMALERSLPNMPNSMPTPVSSGHLPSCRHPSTSWSHDGSRAALTRCTAVVGVSRPPAQQRMMSRPRADPTPVSARQARHHP